MKNFGPDIKQINMLRNVRRTIGEFVQSGGNDVKMKNEVLNSVEEEKKYGILAIHIEKV